MCVCVCVVCMRASDVEGGLPSSIYTICTILYVDDVGVYGRWRSDKTACPLSGRARSCNKTCENSRWARLQKTRSFIYFIFSLHIIWSYVHKWNANDFLRLTTKNPHLETHIYKTVSSDRPPLSFMQPQPVFKRSYQRWVNSRSVTSRFSKTESCDSRGRHRELQSSNDNVIMSPEEFRKRTISKIPPFSLFSFASTLRVQAKRHFSAMNFMKYEQIPISILLMVHRWNRRRGPFDRYIVHRYYSFVIKNMNVSYNFIKQI